MNAFEDIVRLYLEEEGYWVRQSVKVNISKQDKRDIGTFSMPRPEIDLVALNVRENELLLIEVKSFLDSYGVYFEAISDEKDVFSKRYRLFTVSIFREVVTKRLREEYLKQGLINENTKINYALAAGNIHSSADELNIREYFSKPERGWKLFSPKDIKDKIRKMSEKGWEDNLVTITAKLIQWD
ncbi:MAG: hypothetical protein ISS51_01280 [Dehalococcoidales bacterium]|nr:hypothetical protein [Dehalococcoidales bacterium]